MNKQANSRFCFVCGVDNPNGLGMKFYDDGPGEVRAECIVPTKFQGYPGIVHGGIVAAMLDEISGRVFVRGDPPRFMFTVQLSVRYRKPVPTDKLLRLKGRVVKERGRVGYAAGEICSEDGTLLAEAEIVVADVPQEMVDQLGPNDELWKVYPD